MRFLLDTHFLLWIPIDDARLSQAARSLIKSSHHDFVFSVASLWEIAIKRSQGRGSHPIKPAELRHGLIANGYEELPVLGEHAIAVEHLPHIHRDPFDRLLIAQAVISGLTLLTVDATIARYPGPIRKV